MSALPCIVSAPSYDMPQPVLEECRICKGDGCPACDQFTDEYVESVIEEFANGCGNADLDLFDMGFRAEPFGADLFRQLCKAWLADRESVHKVAGTYFWRTAKEIAGVIYSFRAE